MTAIGRRSFSVLLAATATAAVTAGGARAESALVAPIDADEPTIAVAGPPDGEAARWADLLRRPLGPLSAPRELRLRYLGGRDGVTGANMFDARALPDGQAALLFSGGTALAWLAGDTRVRFDAARLLPMLAAVSSGVLCTRDGARGLSGRPLRIGCDAMVAPALTIFMALDMLGVQVQPVLVASGCVEAAQRGEVDAVFARGLDMPAHLESLRQAGLLPVFSVSFPHPGLAAPATPGLPDLATMLGGTPDDRRTLLAAWRAVTAASLLDAVLALPRLCPDASLARWRGACDQARATNALADRLPHTMRLLTGNDSAAAFSAVMVNGATQDALHQWMAERLHWRPT